MLRIIILFLLISNFNLIGQDDYHTNLINTLSDNYQLPTPEYLLLNNDNANNMDWLHFGPGSFTRVNETNGDLDIKNVVTLNAAGQNPWNSVLVNFNKTEIEVGDKILVSFWAKSNSVASELFLFAEQRFNFDKQFYFSVELSSDWQQYFISFESSQAFDVEELAMGIHFAAVAQSFDLAGYTALNYGSNVELEKLPSNFNPAFYGGHESDAEWRSLADERIESIRKANLNIIIVNPNGNVQKDVQIKTEMLEHDFGFGSAFLTCRVPGNSCYDATYIEKLNDLDGKGHGFNIGVTENDLKWDAWEEVWFSNPEQNEHAIRWYNDNGVQMRGHTLFWTGFDMMPDDIRQNQNDFNYIRSRIDERINAMISDTDIANSVMEWDVLNEITTNRDLENIFDNDPNLDTGVDIYKEIFDKIKAINPDQQIYVNDYVVLSGSGGATGTVNSYKALLNELYNHDTPFDGIGFQCHIGSLPVSINRVKDVFDEFYEDYNVPIKITEFDIDSNLDPQIQANYMHDFLMMMFSHPAVEAFIMWGFWDGNHWKGNAPIFNQDWSIKPSGEVFIDKVFNEWWSEEEGTVNDNGEWNSRLFKGKHKITLERDGFEMEYEVNLDDDKDITLEFGALTSTQDLALESVKVFPNPSSDGLINIESKTNRLEHIAVYSTDGRIIHDVSLPNSDKDYQLMLNPGIYLIKVTAAKQSGIYKVNVIK